MVGPPSRLLRMYQQLLRWVCSVSRWCSAPNWRAIQSRGKRAADWVRSGWVRSGHSKPDRPRRGGKRGFAMQALLAIVGFLLGVLAWWQPCTLIAHHADQQHPSHTAQMWAISPGLIDHRQISGALAANQTLPFRGENGTMSHATPIFVLAQVSFISRLSAATSLTT